MLNTLYFVAVNPTILIGSDKTMCILLNVNLRTQLLTLNNAIVILLAENGQHWSKPAALKLINNNTV